MIRDSQGRKWNIRLRQMWQNWYLRRGRIVKKRNTLGWYWSARQGHDGIGVGPCGPHKTRQRALLDAERSLASTDYVAMSQETMAQIQKGKSLCQLDQAAIESAGKVQR
jgi:hypothetical protein